MSAVKVAVIGVGRFGEEHLRTYQQLPGVEVVGVVDSDPARARSIGREFGVHAYTDASNLMTVAAPEAISVAVNAHHHDAILRDLAGYDCTVLVEKPLAIDASTASKLANQLDPSRLMVGHILRFAAPYAALRAHARTSSGPWRGASARTRPADHLRDYPTENIVGLTMIHDLDALLWITGERVESVRAVGERTPAGRWYSVDAQLTLSNGGTWDCHADWTGDDDDSMSLAEARVRVTAASAEFVDPTGVVHDFPGAAETYGAALRAELAHFVECTRTGRRSPIFSLEDAATAVAVGEAILDSLERGGEDIVLH